MQVAMTMRDFSEAHKLDVESVLDLQTRRKMNHGGHVPLWTVLCLWAMTCGCPLHWPVSRRWDEIQTHPML